MNREFRRLGVSTTVFSVVVVAMIVIAGIGYGLYATSNHASMTETMTTTLSGTTETMTTTTGMTETMTTTEMANNTYAYSFAAESGAMVSNAWLLTVPIGMDEFAVSVHAEGLEPNGTYILEGTLTTGNMQNVPISSQSMTMNETSASEFQSNSNGTGTFWIVLSNDPITTFEDIQLYVIPDMMMQNATLVATVSFSMMSETTTMSSSSGM